MDVVVDEKISKLMLEQRPPINIVTMGIDYDQSLKASLDFEYDGVRVPYSKSSMIKSNILLLKNRMKT